MKSKHLIVTLISVSLIALEITWTRIFSAEYFYTFAFLILSLAILGIGLGALATRLFRLQDERTLPLWLLLSGICAAAGPAAVFAINPDFSILFSDYWMMLKFTGIIFILGSAYFFGGIALSLIFKNNSAKLNSLYAADMAGAGLGVLLIFIFMNALQVQSASTLVAVPLLFAALLTSKRNWRIVPAAALIVVLVFSNFSWKYLEAEREERAPVIYKHWDAMGKVKVYKYSPQYYGLNLDNAANSPVYGFDGNWDKPDSMRFPFAIDVTNLISRFDECRFMSLGAGGGTDVLHALQAGAKEVHAVEVNPHINDMMQTGCLQEFSGDIYNDPRVKVVTEDARAYVRQFENKFDVIYSLSANTFAALASGSFAMAENYLFTKEAFADYWEALSEKGFLMMEHQFYVPRMVTEVMTALSEEGIESPKDHFAVYNIPKMHRNIILMSKQPLTDEIRNTAFGANNPMARSYKYLLYPAADSIKDNLVNRIVMNGWESEQERSPIDISPCDDNRPFTAQLGLWKNFSFDNLGKVLPYEFKGFPLAEMLILVILGIVTLLVLPLNIIPFFRKGERLKFGEWLYFFAIGAGFMMIEIILIQKYTLFIGSSIYSLLTIFISILVFSGLGSLFSRKFNNQIPFFAIILLLVIEIFISSQLIDIFGGTPLAVRIVLALVMTAPLSFFLGMPFPKMGTRVGGLIDWGFAVNGAASVIGSTVAVLLAFNFGFSFVLFIAAGVYLIAMLLIGRK